LRIGKKRIKEKDADGHPADWPDLIMQEPGDFCERTKEGGESVVGSFRKARLKVCLKSLAKAMKGGVYGVFGSGTLSRRRGKVRCKSLSWKKNWGRLGEKSRSMTEKKHGGLE